MKIFRNPLFYFILGLLFVTGAIFFWFYPFNGFFYFWDQHGIARYTFENFTRAFFSWNYFTVAPGESNPISLTYIYFMGVNVFFSSIFGYIYGQFFYVLATFFIGYIGVFLLLRHIHSLITSQTESRFSHITIVLFSIFYLFNIFVAMYAYGDFSSYFFFFLFLPLTLYTYLISIKNKLYYPFFLGAVLLQSQSLAQPSYFMNLLVYLALFSAFLLSVFPFFKVLRHYGLSVLLFIPLLSFYFMPLVLIGTYTLQANLSAIGGGQYLDFYRGFSTPLQTITFNNFRLLTITSYQAVGYWVTFLLDNKFLELCSVLLLISVLYLNAKIERGKNKVLATINIILLFISIFIPSIPYVIYTPFKWIWVRFPVIQILRGWDQQMDHYYVIMLIFIVFITLCIVQKKIERIMLLVFFVVFYGIYSYPAITGSFFFNTHYQVKNNPYGNGVSQKVNLPPEYQQLRSAFAKEQFARILIYPWDQILSSDYFTNNTAYAGAHLISELTGKEAIGAGGGDVYYQNLLLDAFYADPYNTNIVSKAKSYGFTDIIVRKKYNTNHFFVYRDIDIHQLEDLLSTTSALLTENKYFNVYHLQNIPIIQGKEVTFKKINPTMFKVYMHNVKGKMDLSFLEGYYPEWKLYILQNPEKNWCTRPNKFIELATIQCQYNLQVLDTDALPLFFRKPIFDNTHSVLNKYANQWIIDPKFIQQNYPKNYFKVNRDGSLDVEFDIYYKPQGTLYLGIIISLITILLISAGIAYSFLRAQYEK